MIGFEQIRSTQGWKTKTPFGFVFSSVEDICCQKNRSSSMRVQSPSGSERVGGQLACRCAMFKLLRVSVSVGALPLSLWLPHCSQNTGSLSPATTCKLPRDLTSRVLHRELAERTEAVNVPHTGARAAIDIIRPAVLALGKIRGDIMVWANFKSEKSEFKI